MRVFVLALVTLSACSAQLDLDDDVDVLCTTNADCIGARICAPTGFCVKELATTPVMLLGASALDDQQVELIFDQALVIDIALDARRYDITPALAIDDVYVSGPAKVVLRTGEQVLGVAYTVTANGLASRDGTFLAPESASATFLGFGESSDTTPPKPIAPNNDALVVGTEQLLVWTPRVGARSYTVTLARDANCTDVVVDTLVAAPASSLAVTLPGLGKFYWCVTADNTAASALGKAAFHATDDAVYVYCAYNDACDLTTNEVGSPDAPFRSAQRAIGLAQQRGLSAVRIATRGGGSTYSEMLQVNGRGVDLEGGYAPTFATRDPSVYPTAFKFTNVALIISDLQSKMAVSGLTLEVTETLSNVAVLISSAPVPVALGNVIVRANGTLATGIAIADAASVTLTGSRVSTTNGARLVGIQVQGISNLYLADTQVLVGNADNEGSSTGIAAAGDASTIDIARSVVMSGESYNGETYGIATTGPLGVHDSRVVARQSLRAYAISMGAGVVERSFIYADGGVVGSGVWVQEPAALVRNNVILATGTGSVGVKLEGGTLGCVSDTAQRVVGNTVVSTYRGLVMSVGAPIITNNLFHVAEAAVEELSVSGRDTVDPLSFENNALIAPTAYFEWNAPPNIIGGVPVTHGNADSVNAIDGQSCLNESGVVIRYSGNIGGDEPLADIFRDIDGPNNLLFEIVDYSVFETVDNDFTLHAEALTIGIDVGGKDATTSTCGVGDQPCEGEAVDLAGQPRTIPWSIGAYERDQM